MPLVLVLLPLFITGGSGSLMSTENVDDVVTKCFDGPLDREDPLRPECTKAFMQFAVDSKTQLHLSKEEINYLWSIEREIQGKMYKHRHKRQASRIYLPIRRECRLMGEAERLKLFRAVNILKHDTRISGDQVCYLVPHTQNIFSREKAKLNLYHTCISTQEPKVPSCQCPSVSTVNMDIFSWG